MDAPKQSRFNLVLRNVVTPSKQRSMTTKAYSEAEAFAIGNRIPGWEVTSAVNLGEAPKSIFSGFSKKKGGPLPEKDIVRFCRGLATMLRAGIPTVEGLSFYADSLPNKVMAELMRQIARAIELGEAPDVAFAKTGKFTSLFTGLIKAGVTSGRLDNALDAIAHQMTIVSTFRAKIRRIIATPLVVLGFLVFLFIAAQNIITPRIEGMLIANRVSPDAFSAAVFAMSHVVQKTWFLVPIVLVLSTIILTTQKHIRVVLLELMMSKWLLLRNLIMSMRQLTFIGTLSMLQNNGIVMDESLQNCISVLKGGAMESEVVMIREQHLSGISLGECIRRYSSCEPAVIHMVKIGEKSAQLPDQLALCTTMLEEQTQEAMADFATFASFMSTIVPVFVIGFTFLSSYLPIILMSARLMQGFGGK